MIKKTLRYIRSFPESRRCRYKFDNSELSDKNIVDIVTIAFNNEQVIFYQNELLKKNFKDSYNYIVADNSNNPQKQKLIFDLCKKQNISYIRIQQVNPKGYFPSLSHAYALNWMYENYIKKRKANYFGFIDHDLFPIKPVNIIHFLDKNPLYGLLQERGDKWYLWPGFNFFASQALQGKKIDFMPCTGLDAGGSNWSCLYSNYDKNTLMPIKHRYKELCEGNTIQETAVEIFNDQWLHILRASELEENNAKNDLVLKMLEDIVKE